MNLNVLNAAVTDGYLKDYSFKGHVARLTVTPKFYLLDYDTKETVAMHAGVYCADQTTGEWQVMLYDSKTGKVAGSMFSDSLRLKLE